MNKQEIMNLKSGDKLDLLIGEKVLGIPAEVDKNGIQRPIKNFSSDTSTLGAIIERMIIGQYQYNISNVNKKHTCVFDNLKTYKRYIAHAQTPMEAVCKASLMAVFDEINIKA